MKAPVKMLFPMVFFIFPSLFTGKIFLTNLFVIMNFLFCFKGGIDIKRTAVVIAVVLFSFFVYQVHNHFSKANSTDSMITSKKDDQSGNVSNKSVESGKPVESDQPVDSSKPVESEKPIESGKPLESSRTKNINGWDLVFDDEFNNNALNPNWTVLEREKNFNNELQAYKKDNVIIQSGRLNLTAKKEVKNGVPEYSSGLIQTKGKLSILYGKVEVKAKYPGGKGLFPAIWMLREDEKDSLPEIDILEAIGSHPTVTYMVHHWRKENGRLTTRFGKSIVENYNHDHIYSMEWEPNEMRWYIDGNQVFATAENIPNIPMYLIINLAVGGNWPGSPDGNTVFPAEFSIDYVKIFKKAGE